MTLQRRIKQYFALVSASKRRRQDTIPNAAALISNGCDLLILLTKELDHATATIVDLQDKIEKLEYHVRRNTPSSSR